MSEDAQPRQVRFSTLIAYGLGDMFGGGSFTVIGLLFMFFLTEFVGLAPFLAGMVFAVGKGFDAVSDPLMGYISDRTRSRYGRRRVYFLAGIVPIALSFAALWVPVIVGPQWARALYYAFAYVFFSAVFTMVMVPYSALNAELTRDYRARTRLSGARMVFSQFSTLLAGTLPGLIVDLAPGADATGYLLMGTAFGVFYALPWILVFLGTWELPDYVRPARQKITAYFREFFRIFRNRVFRIHIAMYIAAYSAVDILMAVFAYFVTYYLERPGLYSLAVGSLLIAQIAMLPVYVRVANARGKGFAYCLGMGLWAGGLILVFFLAGPETPAWLISALCVVMGAGLSAGILIPWAILPTVTDVDELITGRQRAGTYSGAMTLFRKLVQGVVAVPMVGVVLELIGFVSNQPQTPETVERLRAFFVFGPVALIVAGILVATAFPILPETHRIIRAEIERLRAGGRKEDVDEKTRDVCETVTGLSYGELYGGG
ncbi:MAG: MFS transporter [Spirochaetaceae bacterium]